MEKKYLEFVARINKKSLLFFMTAGWLFLVFGYWLSYYANYKFFVSGEGFRYGLFSDWVIGFVLPSVSPFLVVLLIYFFLLGWLYFIKKIRVLVFSISPAVVVLVHFILFLFLLFVIVYVRLNPTLEDTGTILDFSDFYEEFPKLLLYSVESWIAVIVTIILSSSLGRRFMKILKLEKDFDDGILAFSVGSGLGFFILTITLFLLGVFGLLSFWPVLLTMIFLAAVAFGECKESIKWLFRKKAIEFPLRSVSALVFIFIPLLLVTGMIDLMRFMPIEFDSTTYYTNRVRLIVENGGILPAAGMNPFPFELLASGNRVLFGNMIGAFMYGTISLMLSSLVLVGLVRNFSSDAKKHDLLIVPAVWLSLGITYGMAVYMAKPDVFSFFFSTLSLWIFLIWLRNRSRISILYPAFFFAGMAVSMKFTGAIFLASLLIGTFLSFLDWKEKFGFKIKVLIISAFFFAVPLIPWFGLHVWDSVQKTPSIYASKTEAVLDNRAYPFQFSISKDQWKSVGIDYEECARSATGLQEDFNRYYDQDKSLMVRFLAAPWDLSMNRFMRAYVTEISPLFLMFLPIMLLFIIVGRRYRHSTFSRKEIFLICAMAISYWLLWTAVGNGVVWYGLAGFVYFMLPSFLFMINSDVKFLRILFVVVFLVFSIFVMHERSLRMGEALEIRYMVGEITTEQVADGRNTGINRVIQRLNSDPTKKTWAVSNTSFYYLVDPKKQVHVDTFLDEFNCLYKERDAGIASERLKALDIDYIYIGYGLNNLPDEKGTFRKKMDAFQEFAKNNLKLEESSPSYSLYSVPQ